MCPDLNEGFFCETEETKCLMSFKKPHALDRSTSKWIGLQTCVVVFVINHSIVRLCVSAHEALFICMIYNECST